MSNPETAQTPVTIADFTLKHGIRFECHRVESRPDGLMSGEQDNMRHFRVRISAPCCKGYHLPKKLVGFGLYFSQGSAHTENPTLADVLDCLASDASGYENAKPSRLGVVGQVFEEWCCEYGYDADSRKAEKTFRAIKRQAEQLKRTLGQEAYEELLWNTERL